MAAIDLFGLKQEWRYLIENKPDVLSLFEPQLQTCPKSPNTDLKRKAQAVFMNDVILREIFSFLKLEHIKRLRLVCRKWKSVGEVFFKKRGQICFDYDLPRRPLNLRVFLQNAQVEFPFKSLVFKGPLPLSTLNLNLLFANEAKFITQLTLKSIRFSEEDRKMNQKNENRSYLREYNFNDILSSVENLKSLEIRGRQESWIENLKSLEICGRQETSTKLKLSLANLRNIKYIILEYCTIELSPCTIAPIELQLRGVNFSRENFQVEIVRLNDFVEFDVAQEITIINSMAGNVDMELDLVGDVTLNRLHLMNVKLCNLELASWNVKFLEISSDPFTKKSNLKIESISFSFSELNISCLPLTVNKLCLGLRTEFVGIELDNISLPNIKCLELKEKSAVDTLFPYVATCFNNLRQLKLSHCYSSELFKIDINHIPKSVEILIFVNCRFRFVGEGIFELNSLIIETDNYYNLQFVAKVTKHFFPKDLDAKGYICTDKPLQPENGLNHLQSLLNTSIPRILLGKLPEQHRTYLESCPSYKVRHNIGEIVNSNGSKITFSF